MKNNRAKWTLGLEIKATFGEPEEPASKTRMSVTSSYGWVEGQQLSTMECLAMDLAQLVMVAEKVLVPAYQKAIVAAFAEELEALNIGIIDIEEEACPPPIT